MIEFSFRRERGKRYKNCRSSESLCLSLKKKIAHSSLLNEEVDERMNENTSKSCLRVDNSDKSVINQTFFR